jgi:PAS domain S-box-containing protein
MENIVLSEFRQQAESLRQSLRKKYNLPDKEIDNITGKLESALMQMIGLVKEGKSAHEKFFSDIILNSIDAIVGLDKDHKIFLWNKGAEHIFGYTKTEITGKDFSLLIPGYLLKKGEKEFLITEIKEKGFIANYETERITKSGEIKNTSISRFIIFNEANESIGSVGIIRDITQIKKLEQELLEKEKFALIGEVVSSIAHSLSNPLNIISGNADYLLLDKKENDKEYEELKTILDETTRITKSIRHLLNFSRPLQIDKRKNNINELIEKIAVNLKFIINKKDVKIKKSLGKDIPLFEFDQSQIEEAILNIINNSVQSIHQKGEINLKTSYAGKKVFIEISDSGPGISKENLSKVFLPFFSTKEYGKGTGLGLPIAKRIISNHNGDIKIISKPGKGTKFIISFPD